MKNIYCNELTVDFTFDRTALDKIIASYDKVDERWTTRIPLEELDPQVDAFLKPLGLMIVRAEVFYVPANQESPHPHIDSSKFSNRVKLNWVYGAPNSTMKWWEPYDKEAVAKVMTTRTGSLYGVYDGPMYLAHEEKIGLPSMVNSGHLHSITNPDPTGRWCVSCSVGDEPGHQIEWEQALPLLKPFFKV